jgi:hypothetical protein
MKTLLELHNTFQDTSQSFNMIRFDRISGTIDIAITEEVTIGLDLVPSTNSL